MNNGMYRLYILNTNMCIHQQMLVNTTCDTHNVIDINDIVW